MSCVGGAQGKPLRWRVEEQPCHTGAQCGAPPTRTGHGRAVRSQTGATSRGRGQPPQHQLPLNGSDGQRRSGEAAQLPPPATTAASLPRIQPGAVQASRPSARGPGAQGPMLQEEMGRIMPRRPGGGGDLYRLFQALQGATSAAQLSGLLRTHPASPCNQLAEGHLRQLEQQPQASGLRDGGGGWGGRVTLGRCEGSVVGGVVFIFV